SGCWPGSGNAIPSSFRARRSSPAPPSRGCPPPSTTPSRRRSAGWTRPKWRRCCASWTETAMTDLDTALDGTALDADRERLLAALRRGNPPRSGTALPHADRSVPLPVSFAQRQLWFLDQLAPGSAAYLVCAAVRLD